MTIRARRATGLVWARRGCGPMALSSAWALATLLQLICLGRGLYDVLNDRAELTVRDFRLREELHHLGERGVMVDAGDPVLLVLAHALELLGQPEALGPRSVSACRRQVLTIWEERPT